MPAQTTADLARVIQLSVTPVFLLLSIGGLLGVIANRVARVVDRARRLHADVADATAPPGRVREELGVLARRATLNNRAIALCVVSALLVAAVIIALFLGVFFGENVVYAVSLLFIAALVCLGAALILFLQEIRLATLHLRIAP